MRQLTSNPGPCDSYLSPTCPLHLHPKLLPEAKMAPKKLNFITANKGKLREAKEILGNTVELHSQPLDLIEIQGTIEEVSVDKCRRAAEEVR